MRAFRCKRCKNYFICDDRGSHPWLKECLCDQCDREIDYSDTVCNTIKISKREYDKAIVAIEL